MCANASHLVRLGLFVALGAAAAQGVPPRSDGLDMLIRTIDHDATPAELMALSLRDGATVRTAEEGERHIPTEDLVRVTSLKADKETTTHTTIVKLSDGGLVYGRISAALEGAAGDTVAIETEDLGELQIPLEAIQRMDLPGAASAEFAEALSRLESRGRDDEDRVLLSNGDVVRGFITTIDQDRISLEATTGEIEVPRPLAVAIRMARSTQPEPPRPHFVIGLRSGGRQVVTDFNGSGDTASARLRYGQIVRIKIDRLSYVDVVGGRWEWLGEHRPISYEHTPMLALDWPYAIDANVLGGPLIVDGERFDHGVGVHSRSSLTYDLKGGYREFVTSFGIDDDSGPYADVTAIFLVDGKRRHIQEHVRRGARFGPVRLDVSKAKRIELVVDFGDNGDMQDRFDWVDAALIR